MKADSLPPEVLLAALVSAMDSAAIGCSVLVAEEGTFRRAYSNAQTASILGMTVEEFRRTAPLSRLKTEDAQRLSTMAASGASAPPTFQTEVTKSDGSVVPVEISTGTVPLEHGGRAVVGFLRDLGPRLAIEAALRESEQRFRAIAESCPDAITMVADERYVYGNPAALLSLGVTSQEELAKLDLMEPVPKELRQAIVDRRARVLAGEVVPPFELRWNNGRREIFVEISTRLTTLSGRPAVVSYARDITERRELHARLTQQDRLATVGTLAAGLAHELNTPLTYIALHLKRLGELVRTRPPGVETEAFTEILAGTSRMQAVISDLLFLTKDSDRPQAHVDVGQVLTSTLSLVRAGAKTGARITSELAATSSILAHASRLGQVFLNVILNALEAVAHREDGLVHVELRESGLWLEVRVTDNGLGLTEQSRSRAFDAFFTTKPAGTGLGLSISHAIVTAHGGEISIESPAPEGAIVRIRLPTMNG